MRNFQLSIKLGLITGLLNTALAAAQSDLTPAAPLGMQARRTGEISVVVTDPSGAVIPNANIQLHEKSGEAVVEGVTNQEGRVTLTGLPVGSYFMEVSAQGFRSDKQDVATEAGNKIDLHIQLAVGSCSPCVEVEIVPIPIKIDHPIETDIQPIPFIQLISLPPHKSNILRRFFRKKWHRLGF